MKILHVITSLQIGGAEKLVADMVPLLRKHGHKVDVCVFNGQDTPFMQKLNECGCRVIRLSNNENYYHPIKILKLWRVMRGYDIVHTHNTAPQLFVAIAAKLLCSVVLVTTEHNTSNRRRDWKWYPRWIDRWMYDQYQHVICISKQAEDNLRTYIGNCRAHISTIYNGIDVEAYHQVQPNILLRDGSLRFVVVMVAGFRYQKDHNTLIRALSLLNSETFELWLVGDGERRKELEALVEYLGLQNCVKFWGLRTDIPEILHSADVVVMSSHFEGLSLSNIEGMSVGKPFIASDVDGLREVTKGYGILFPHEDAEALATFIQKLHDDHSYYQRVADKCYERAREFDISVMVRHYNELYLSLSHR